MNDLKSDPVKVLYIAGEARSGSTLMDRLLGETGRFFSSGELHMIWRHGFMEDLLCGCGAKIRYCTFWGAVMREGFGGEDRINAKEAEKAWLTIARLRHLPLMFIPQRWWWTEQRQSVAKLAAYWCDLYYAIKKVSGCRVVVDSSKSPMGAYVLGQIPGIELYVLHLVRDSRAVAYSSQRAKVRPEVTDQQLHLLKRTSLSTAVFWTANNLAAERLRESNPRYRRIHYEQLVKQPKQVLKEIGDFVGEAVNFEMFTGEHTVLIGQNHTVAGNPDRFKQGPIEIALDSEWQRKMPWLNRAALTILTAPLLRSYGYLEKLESWRY